MVGVTEIGGAMSGLKAAMDIAKGINAAAGEIAINEATIKLQRTILEAQEKLLAAQELQAEQSRRVEELEARLAQADAWTRERERYVRREFPAGTFAYVLKDGDESGEPPHRLCPTCFEDGHKSILQTKNRHS